MIRRETCSNIPWAINKLKSINKITIRIILTITKIPRKHLRRKKEEAYLIEKEEEVILIVGVDSL